MFQYHDLAGIGNKVTNIQSRDSKKLRKIFSTAVETKQLCIKKLEGWIGCMTDIRT